NLVFWLNLPFLVVTTITPFAPRAPYKAVADASFNTLTDSMLFGSILVNGLYDSIIEAASCPLPTTTPSITYRGFGVPTNDPTPRMAMMLVPPGCPLFVEKDIPATRPFNTSSIEATGASSKSSLLTTVFAPTF